MEHWKRGHVFEDGGNRRLGRRTSPAGLVVSLTNGLPPNRVGIQTRKKKKKKKKKKRVK